jgi:DNA-directed RNA polymerase specialized sigma24 family protein
MSDNSYIKPEHKERSELFISLYKKSFPLVAKHVSNRGGSFDEAKDVFQDALVIYYEKVITEGVVINTSPQAYLTGIARHLWLKKYKEASNTTPLDDFDIADSEVSEPVESKLLHYLETAGQKCLQLLSAFYYDKLSMNHIAEAFGFSGERSATVQKYKCLEKVRDSIKKKSLTYEDFLK